MAKRGAKKKPRQTISRSRDNLQTVIVSKSIAPTRGEAEVIARQYARRIYTSRQTKGSWRFRQRPPEDFKKGSFRTFKVPGREISLVYGILKNPDTNYRREVKLYRKYAELIPEAVTLQELGDLSRQAHAEITSMALLDQLDADVTQHAAQLGRRFSGDVYESAKHIRQYGQQELFSNPMKVMPDPGPCAWLGDLIEFKWRNDEIERIKKRFDKHLYDPEELWENGKKEWLFLWSPKMKAVIGIPRPKGMRKQSKVSRKGGAAKISERFKARNAESTHEIDIPKVKLLRLGSAIHIVYRSDKWNPGRDVDYIHDFKNGVELFCGPNLKRPQIFLCKGGKLTVTERGLVF